MSLLSKVRFTLPKVALPPGSRSLLVNALLIATITAILLGVTGIFWRIYFNDPPIVIERGDPEQLGELCPGQKLTINNTIHINDDIIVFYYVSTMDVPADFNYVGTQRAFTDQLHPHPSVFKQELPWTVPVLPPGDYARVFGVRNVGSVQDVLFVFSFYTIPPGCPDDP